MPGGQSATEAQAPVQAAEASPARLPNVPAGQSEHDDEPASEKVPGGQRWHAGAPGARRGGDHVPAGHTGVLVAVAVPLGVAVRVAVAVADAEKVDATVALGIAL